MKKLTFKELAKKILEEEKKPLTVEEIWGKALEKGYNELVGTTGKTPWRTIGAQIYVDIRDNPNSPFIKIDSKPRKFFLKSLQSNLNEIKIEEKKSENKFSSFKEKDLHSVLSYFAYAYMNVHTKTIRHQKSKKGKYSQWLHPDLVGVYFPLEEWKTDVIDFAKEIGSTLITLYSFELKKEISFNNLREAFFQAVSNSSWANEGYLASAHIFQDDELFSELKRLSTAFGIGIIKLDIENPDNSEILFSAKRKNQLDWETINKLASENPDFKTFLNRVRIDLSSKEIRKEKYDKVYEPEEIVKKLKK